MSNPAQNPANSGDKSAQGGGIGPSTAGEKQNVEGKKLPQLGALEDDDEFEVSEVRFPSDYRADIQSRSLAHLVCPCEIRSSYGCSSRYSAEQSGNVLDALAKSGQPGDHLWEDNWDDDDIEDDFTKQLR